MEPKKIFENISWNREGWLEAKRLTIGSSEIGTVLGLNDYQSPLELWAEKTGKIEPFKGNDSTKLGQFLEPGIASFFAHKNNVFLEKCDDMYVHPRYEWASATPDYFILDGALKTGIVECKNTNINQSQKWEDGAPSMAHIQLIWQLGVLGLDRGHLAALIGGSAANFKDVPIIFSKEVFDTALERAKDFLVLVNKDIPPGAGVGDKALIEKLIGVREEKTIEFESYFESTLSEYLKIKAEISEDNKRIAAKEDVKKGYEARILQELGSATCGVIGRYSAKATERVIEPYQNKGSRYTVLTVKEAK